MHWYSYLFCLLAGMLISNSLPHLIQGVSGNRFPTPFSKPPGVGLSSAFLNVIWGLANLIVGYILYKSGNVSNGGTWAFIIFFIGFAAVSLMSSLNFAKKHKD